MVLYCELRRIWEDVVAGYFNHLEGLQKLRRISEFPARQSKLGQVSLGYKTGAFTLILPLDDFVIKVIFWAAI
jgi:hypothetical protein